MNERKQEICALLDIVRSSNMLAIAALKSCASIEDYRHLTRMENGRTIWTEALQQAINENQIIMIPAAEEPYYIDSSLRMCSNRHIEVAPGAVIRLMDGVRVLMLRSEHTLDGTHAPLPEYGRDVNISINGGRWEEWHSRRAGYGKSGMYDEARSFYGVSACMFFDNIETLTLTNMTFAHTAGFAIQLGDAKNVVIENIVFDSCYADGIHINGNTEYVIVRNISGTVGDDLVALNAYDWQNSSVNFGPGRMMLCEDIISAPGHGYKSMRLEPGVYAYDDGSQVDCSLTDIVIRRVKGVHTFKLYYQTPAYELGSEPEPGRQGSAGNIFFEDIDIDLSAPVDGFSEYLESDPVRGVFAAIEIGADMSLLHLENVRLTLHRDRYPLSCLIAVGPKSIRVGNKEIFDPYISCRVGRIELHGVTVNGEPVHDAGDIIRTVCFDDINSDGRSTGRGEIDDIEIYR